MRIALQAERMSRCAKAMLALLLAIAAIASGCRGEAASPATGSASCVASLVYGGHVYIGHHAGTAVIEGRSLGRGSFPPCNDTGPTTGVER